VSQSFETLELVNGKVWLKFTIVDEPSQEISLDISHKDYTSKGFALSEMRLHLTLTDLDRLSTYIYDVQERLALDKMRQEVAAASEPSKPASTTLGLLGR